MELRSWCARRSREASMSTPPVTLGNSYPARPQYLHLENGGLEFMVTESLPVLLACLQVGCAEGMGAPLCDLVSGENCSALPRKAARLRLFATPHSLLAGAEPYPRRVPSAAQEAWGLRGCHGPPKVTLCPADEDDLKGRTDGPGRRSSARACLGCSGSLPAEMSSEFSAGLRVLWGGSCFKVGGPSLIQGAASHSCDLV